MSSVVRQAPPPDDDITKAARLNFSRASVALMRDKKTAFYSHLLMEQELVWTDTVVPIAGVDAHGRLYLNPRGIHDLSVKQMVFVLWHELEHVLRLHPQRLHGRDAYQWNIAGDMVINADRHKYRIGEFIEGCIDTPDQAGRLTETVYNELPPRQQPPEPSEGESGNQPTDNTSGEQDIGGTGGDLVQGDPMSEDGGQSRPPTREEIRQAEAKAKGRIARASQAARVAGNMSEEMQRRVEAALEVHTPWYEIVERFMTDRAATDYSWTKPNRRFLASGLYLPSLQSQGSLGVTVVIRDVSGSCSGEQEEFMGHMNNIMERCTPRELYVLDTSTRVHTPHHFVADEFPVEPEITGGGGTDLRAGFQWIDENISENIDVCIVLTDGYTDWPDAPTDYPVVVLCTTDIEVGFGDEVVRYHPESS